MEFRPGDMAQDVQTDPQADPPHPYAGYARLTGRWFLLPLLAILAATALVEAIAARTQRKD